MSPDAASPPAMPSVPARFQVLEELPAGPGARLLRARDTLLQREVFLKHALPDLEPAVGACDLHERRLREARARARIEHPAVQRLLDVVELPAGPLLILEPVTGETLATRLAREGRLDPAEVLALGSALAGALEVVHGAGVLHRGLTSDCIVLGDGERVTLTGFQFAKAASPSHAAEPSSLIRGPGALDAAHGAHPAPEQFSLRQDSPRADLFTLGWVLFESLTGAPPYREVDPRAWKTATSARSLVPQTPLELDRLLAACLAPSPAERPADAKTLRRALEAAREHGQVHGTAPRSGAPRPARPRWFWPSVALVAGAAQVLLLVGLLRPAGPGEARGVWAVSAPGATPSASGASNGRATVALHPRYARSQALLIGIGAYGGGFQPLANAERDVALVRQALLRDTTARWEFTELVGASATRAGIVDAFHDLCGQAGSDDRVLIYFAGHGKRNERADGVGWMIPADATVKPSSWIPFNEFDQMFREDPGPKHILVAMDCCYGGRVIHMLPTRDADTTGYSERFLTRKAHIVLTSGSGDERVSDGVKGESSPFAKAFAQAILERGPPLTASQLYAEIQQRFAGWGLAQVPLMGRALDATQDGGDFVFFREAP